MPTDAIAGILFSLFRKEFPELLQQPIAQLPEEAWNTPALIYRPHHHLVGPQGMVLVGPRAIAISDLAPYSGWELFRPRIVDVLTKCRNAEIYKTPIRVGLRYINFFERDVLEQLKISAAAPDLGMTTETTQITLSGRRNDFLARLIVSNAALVEDRRGTVIDIDISRKFESDEAMFEDTIAQLDLAHQLEKDCFFELIGDTLVSELAPEY